MSNITNGHFNSSLKNFSVETVRNLLDTDNKGIAKLCAQVSLMPKKDEYGRTYFTKDDLEILRRVKAMNQEVQEVKNQNKKAYATVPVKSQAPDSKLQKSKTAPSVTQRITEESSLPEGVQPMPKAVNFPMTMNSNLAVEKICSAFADMEASLKEKMSQLLEEKLDEKLDGMDEVVVELVRCKTENETLRYKMNELNKEVYNLKNELSKYKPLGMGFYIKGGGTSSLL